MAVELGVKRAILRSHSSCWRYATRVLFFPKLLSARVLVTLKRNADM